jgi:hypothetical protein
MLEFAPRDTTPVVLNEDQQVVMAKALNRCCSGLQTLVEFANHGILDAELCRNVLSTTEHELANVSKIIGVEIDSAANIERRHAKLRAANMRIHELEAQLGSLVTARHLQQGMEQFNKKLHSWWDLEGFGLVSEVKLSAYGNCEVTFSCSLFGSNGGIFSKTPVSDKERHKLWLEDLGKRGFVLVKSRHHGEAIVDCEASRQVLSQLFAQRMPSARITSYTNWGDTNELFTMRDVKVVIRDLADIETLPQMPEAD